MQSVLLRSTKKVASLARGTAALIQDEYKLTFEDNCVRVLEVRPQLLAAEFPRNMHEREMLPKRLSRDHGEDYLLLNLSGKSYDTGHYRGPVLDILMCGCVAPVEVILRLCVSAHAWLSRSMSRCLVAHGGVGAAVNPLPWSRSTAADAAGAFGPVVMFFACYLSWAGLAANPLEAMIEVCEALRVPEDAIVPSHRRYLRNFELLQRGLVDTVKVPRLRLLQVVLEGVGGDGEARVLRVLHLDRVVLQAEVPFADELCSSMVRAPTCEIPACRGDVCVQVFRKPKAAKHTSEGDAYVLEIQVCFHLAFVNTDDVLRFCGRELDTPGLRTPADDCIVDVFFENAAPNAADAAPDGIAEALAAAPSREELSAEQNAREEVAAATAAAAATAGPRRALAFDDEEDLWSAEALVRDAPCFRGEARHPPSTSSSVVATASASSVTGPQVYHMATDDEPDLDKKLVFSPDGIDSFFDDLI